MNLSDEAAQQVDSFRRLHSMVEEVVDEADLLWSHTEDYSPEEDELAQIRDTLLAVLKDVRALVGHVLVMEVLGSAKEA